VKGSLEPVIKQPEVKGKKPPARPVEISGKERGPQLPPRGLTPEAAPETPGEVAVPFREWQVGDLSFAIKFSAKLIAQVKTDEDLELIAPERSRANFEESLVYSLNAHHVAMPPWMLELVAIGLATVQLYGPCVQSGFESIQRKRKEKTQAETNLKETIPTAREIPRTVEPGEVPRGMGSIVDKALS